MQTTVYQCDVCKKSKSKEDLSNIRVNTRGITISTNYYHPDVEFDICKECLEKKGFIVNPKPELSSEEIAKKNCNNLENKLVEILVDLGVQFYE